MFQAFKSLLIGAHLYAGLTHGPRTIVADPAKVASMVEPLTSEGMSSAIAAVSMSMNSCTSGVWVQSSGCRICG